MLYRKYESGDISALPDNIFKPNLPAIKEYISKQK